MRTYNFKLETDFGNCWIVGAPNKKQALGFCKAQGLIMPGLTGKFRKSRIPKQKKYKKFIHKFEYPGLTEW